MSFHPLYLFPQSPLSLLPPLSSITHWWRRAEDGGDEEGPRMATAGDGASWVQQRGAKDGACRARSASTFIVGYSSYQSSSATVVEGGNSEKETGDGDGAGEIGGGDGAVEIGGEGGEHAEDTDGSGERERKGERDQERCFTAASSILDLNSIGGDEEGPRTAAGGSGDRADDAIRLCLHRRSLELATSTVTT
uniref:Uncharacterized protein n=1 Tax=Oryza meridionalis TaxID=40149 RepID=A0A0E0EXI5_9ORYZ